MGRRTSKAGSPTASSKPPPTRRSRRLKPCSRQARNRCSRSTTKPTKKTPTALRYQTRDADHDHQPSQQGDRNRNPGRDHRLLRRQEQQDHQALPAPALPESPETLPHPLQAQQTQARQPANTKPTTAYTAKAMTACHHKHDKNKRNTCESTRAPQIRSNDPPDTIPAASAVGDLQQMGLRQRGHNGRRFWLTRPRSARRRRRLGRMRRNEHEHDDNGITETRPRKHLPPRRKPPRRQTRSRSKAKADSSTAPRSRSTLRSRRRADMARSICSAVNTK